MGLTSFAPVWNFNSGSKPFVSGKVTRLFLPTRMPPRVGAVGWIEMSDDFGGNDLKLRRLLEPFKELRLASDVGEFETH